MDNKSPKTIEEHREYLYEITKLQLFFAHRWLHSHPDENFVDVLRGRIDIYRKSDVNDGTINPTILHWDDPRWQSMEQQADAIYRECRELPPEVFERRAFAVFKDSLDARCERDFHDQSEVARYQCGCLRHNLSLSPEGNLGFHIANFHSPDSFFDHPDYVVACFRKLLRIARDNFNAKNISTGSWLNCVPKWLAYFPQVWTDRRTPPNTDVKWHYGFWGQFITARKTFNFKYGKYLRETGKMPFYPRFSFCSLQEMNDKLDSLLLD